jgi:hypothetical protein
MNGLQSGSVCHSHRDCFGQKTMSGSVALPKPLDRPNQRLLRLRSRSRSELGGWLHTLCLPAHKIQVCPGRKLAAMAGFCHDHTRHLRPVLRLILENLSGEILLRPGSSAVTDACQIRT